MHGIKFRPVPSRKHHKNPFDPKKGVIRSIFIRLKHESPNANISILALRHVTIANDVYGSDVMSAFEIAKVFTKALIDGTTPLTVSPDLITARETLMAKRKLNLILRTKATVDPVIHPGDLVQV